MKCSVSRFLGIALTGCLAAAGLSLLSASDVSAASYPSEVLLGTFWESDNNTTDTVYWSTDGVNFYELSEAYTDATPNDPSTSWIAGTPYNVSTLHDPSIIYKAGYFYMLSGFSQNNRIIPIIGQFQGSGTLELSELRKQHERGGYDCTCRFGKIRFHLGYGCTGFHGR